MNWITDVARSLRNLGAAIIRDPVWFIIAVVLAPFRAWRYILFVLAVTFGVTVVMLILFLWLEHAIGLAGSNPIVNLAFNLIFGGIILAVVCRLSFGPLIDHFGYDNGISDTHGSARFGSKTEVMPLVRAQTGLLIGRGGDLGLIRYDGPAHLLTMAPTRTGKGVGTIIPNLLTQGRSIICIDPKGENAIITTRARRMFGPVHVLDPFGVTNMPSAAFNPFDALDPQGIDVAEDAATLADALVYDEPGQGGEAHWNEEAKALIGGIILYIAAAEPPSARNLSQLRHHLTGSPTEFLNLLTAMSHLSDCGGLIRRAANRQLSKSDREAAGVLSSAQRHTHFLDSPRMTKVLARSDFTFGDLKSNPATVFLVLPPDRLATYSRWLRLLITQSLTDMARTPARPKNPVLYLLDEFAALGHLAPVERAMGLMAGYGVQLWTILQDIHQLKATYGQRAGTFLSNAGVLQVFGVNDHESAKLISDLLGQSTVVFRTMSQAMDSDGSGISYAEQHTGRPLLTPDEVRNLPGDAALLFIAGQRPHVVNKLRYYADREFREMWDKP